MSRVESDDGRGDEKMVSSLYEIIEVDTVHENIEIMKKIDL